MTYTNVPAMHVDSYVMEMIYFCQHEYSRTRISLYIQTYSPSHIHPLLHLLAIPLYIAPYFESDYTLYALGLGALHCASDPFFIIIRKTNKDQASCA